MSLVAKSDDRRIFTFNSLDHAKDISKLDSYTLYMCMQNAPTGTEPSAFAGKLLIFVREILAGRLLLLRNVK